LKKDIPVSIDAIAKAVTDAGFSVRYLIATLQLNSVLISANNCFTFENINYQFINNDTTQPNGNVVLKFIGKQFLPKTEFKKEWNNTIKPSCDSIKLKTYYVKLCINTL
jgi:hypothetical protein